MIEPPDPLECGELDVLEGAPRPTPPNDLGLEESDDGLGERIVVRVVLAAHGRFDSGHSQPLRVADREILHASIAVMDQALRFVLLSVADRLLECVECQVAS